MKARPVIRERLWCRLCSGRMELKLSLKATPIANNYADKPDEGAAVFPLELSECSSCKHVQQRFVIDGLFEDYKYTTPLTVATHLEPSAKLLKERFPDAKRVLEIGSNNGTYLKVLRAQGFEAVGIDPAATGEGNIKDYFNLAWAGKYSASNERFDLIVANNVFAHIDDLKDVFEGADRVLSKDGAIVFEVQYFHSLVAAGTFDMIYHEHMDYHTLASLAKFLKRMGMVMTGHDFIPTHGGSIRVTASRFGEAIKFWEAPIDWAAFHNKIEKVRANIKTKLNGRKVVLLGAAAKVTTLIYHCGIADHILFACDDTPEKQGRYVPGTNIEIMPTTALRNEPALLGAWNYEKEFRAKFPDNELINPFS